MRLTSENGVSRSFLEESIMAKRHKKHKGHMGKKKHGGRKRHGGKKTHIK
jgi:hypothetical protein